MEHSIVPTRSAGVVSSTGRMKSFLCPWAVLQNLDRAEGLRHLLQGVVGGHEKVPNRGHE